MQLCLRLLIAYFKFWDGMQNFILNMWEIALSNIFVQGRVVYFYVYSFCYGPIHIVAFPAYDSKVVHCCYVDNSALMFRYR